jgi:hypothetical protein
MQVLVRKLRTVLFAFLFAFAISAARAQSNEPATHPARETPPDVKAYQDANATSDRADKIAALEKFKKDFPNSLSIVSANTSILSTLASKLPDQTARIRQFAKAVLEGAKDKKEKGSLSSQIAEILVTNHVLVENAEKYVKASVDSMKQSEYIADQKAQFAKRAASRTGDDKPAPPTDQELITRFNQSRAVRLAMLGRIEFELGKIPVALKILNQAHAADHSLPGAEGTLGEIAVQKGDYSKGLDYLVSARLAGQAAPSHHGGAGDCVPQDARRRDIRARRTPSITSASQIQCTWMPMRLTTSAPIAWSWLRSSQAPAARPAWAPISLLMPPSSGIRARTLQW